MVDSFRNWSEILDYKLQSTEERIKFLRETFAMFGVPERVLSDIEAQLTYIEFKNLGKGYAVEHFTISIDHPRMVKLNGLLTLSKVH